MRGHCARMDDWYGAPSAQAEHRTTGQRAWCFGCHEWCYPAPHHCLCCQEAEGFPDVVDDAARQERDRLRTALTPLIADMRSCQYQPVLKGGTPRDWADRIEEALEDVRHLG